MNFVIKISFLIQLALTKKWTESCTILPLESKMTKELRKLKFLQGQD